MHLRFEYACNWILESKIFLFQREIANQEERNFSVRILEASRKPDQCGQEMTLPKMVPEIRGGRELSNFPMVGAVRVVTYPDYVMCVYYYDEFYLDNHIAHI